MRLFDISVVYINK